ncbi:ATP-binding protein [Radicibacter daui]|uniref:ATP-binding protein n=1 Tax=Radicibacter daui TaxID=3064829 RepID=UPI0040469F9B
MNRPGFPAGALALFFSFVLMALLPCSSRPATAETVLLPADGGTVPLKGLIDVLPDPQAQLDIDTVRRLTADFRPVAGNYNAGQTGGATWFHLKLAQPADSHQNWRLLINPPYLTDLRIWAISAAGDILIGPAHTGLSVPTAERPLDLPVLATPLGLTPGTSADIYIRLQSDVASILRLELRSPESLQSHASWMALFSGLVAGVCGFAFFTSVIHYLWLRDRTFLWYCIFLAGSGALQLLHTGGLSALMPAGFPRLPTLIGLAGVPVSLTAFFLFLHHLLDIKGRFPLIYGLQRLIILSSIVGGILLPFTGFHALAGLFGILLIAGVWSGLYAGVRTALRGDRTALLITTAFSASVIGSTISALRAMGILDPGFLVEQAQPLAFLTQVMLMSVGLAARLKSVTHARLLAEEAARLTAEQAGTWALELARQRTGELAEAKAELEMALAQERAALRQHAHFIDMISHEYRTPLAILSSNLDTLMLDEGGTPDVTAATQGMKSALRRLRDIFESGLRQLGADAPTPQSRFETIPVIDMLIGVVEEARAGYPDCRIDLTHSLPPSARLRADAALLRVALLNLVANACRFSPSQELVTVAASLKGERLAITVSDRGIGIPADEISRVTEKYYRASNSRTLPGSGLGLAIVERVARLHEGQIILESREGAGTTARLMLPASIGGQSRG